jgi:polar amino acid transport system substrate-binding protein
MGDFKHLATLMAPTGELRVAVNMRNDLLVSHRKPDGGPAGLAPSVAAAFAERLGVPLKLVPYATPGELADSAATDAWDVAMLGADPARAKYVDFTAPYCEIEATYCVPMSSKLQSIDEVDGAGIRIAVCAKAAYDLWLERNIKGATVERIEGHNETYAHFREKGLEVLAGLRWKLQKDQAKHFPNTRILPGRFMSVEQAACTKKGRDEGFKALSAFIEEVKADGRVLKWMQEFKVDDRLVVGPPAAQSKL